MDFYKIFADFFKATGVPYSYDTYGSVLYTEHSFLDCNMRERVTYMKREYLPQRLLTDIAFVNHEREYLHVVQLFNEHVNVGNTKQHILSDKTCRERSYSFEWSDIQESLFNDFGGEFTAEKWEFVPFRNDLTNVMQVLPFKDRRGEDYFLFRVRTIPHQYLFSNMNNPKFIQTYSDSWSKVGMCSGNIHEWKTDDIFREHITPKAWRDFCIENFDIETMTTQRFVYNPIKKVYQIQNLPEFGADKKRVWIMADIDRMD